MSWSRCQKLFRERIKLGSKAQRWHRWTQTSQQSSSSRLMCDCFPSKTNLSLIDWHSLCGGVDSIRDCWRYTTTSCDGLCESFQICTRRRASPGPRCGRAAGRLRGVCFRVFNNVYFCQAAHSFSLQVLHRLVRTWLSLQERHSEVDSGALFAVPLH